MSTKQLTRASLLAVSVLVAACGGSSSTPMAAAGVAGTAALSWSVPAQNTDGTALTDLNGYRIVYGTSPSALSQSVEVAGPSTTSRTITGLAPGTYFFAVAAVNASGVTSEPSNAVAMTVQ